MLQLLKLTRLLHDHVKSIHINWKKEILATVVKYSAAKHGGLVGNTLESKIFERAHQGVFHGLFICCPGGEALAHTYQWIDLSNSTAYLRK